MEMLVLTHECCCSLWKNLTLVQGCPTTVVLETVLHVQERETATALNFGAENCIEVARTSVYWPLNGSKMTCRSWICSTCEVKVGLPGMPCLIKAVSRGRCCEQCQELAKTSVVKNRCHVETVSGSSHQTYLRNKWNSFENHVTSIKVPQCAANGEVRGLRQPRGACMQLLGCCWQHESPFWRVRGWIASSSFTPPSLYLERLSPLWVWQT